MSENIKFRIPNGNDLGASIRRPLCASHTARNRADVEAHIKERGSAKTKNEPGKR